MSFGETLYLTNRKKWRIWLRKNHKVKKEIWLIYYKKHTGIARIPYNDAVEEALCYGWIDSTVKRIDDNKFMQKFTPRREKSNWSDHNVKRAKELIKTNQMTKIGLNLYNNRSVESKKTALTDPKLDTEMSLAMKKAFKTNKTALKNFNNFAPGYKRLYINWVNSAKRKETIERRIKQVVERSTKNLKPGML
ncbi:MAG: hypothetical protein GY870_07440 [archaeon]|nr:hypothetical protein [archaeon]